VWRREKFASGAPWLSGFQEQAKLPDALPPVSESPSGGVERWQGNHFAELAMRQLKSICSFCACPPAVSWKRHFSG
jgi:hypothetical protein